jgi:hypothetical protein
VGKVLRPEEAKPDKPVGAGDRLRWLTECAGGAGEALPAHQAPLRGPEGLLLADEDGDRPLLCEHADGKQVDEAVRRSPEEPSSRRGRARQSRSSQPSLPVIRHAGQRRQPGTFRPYLGDTP